MALFRKVFMAAALVGSIAGGMAFAQSQSTPPPTAQPAAKPAKPADSLVRTARKDWDGINTITRRQWNRMRVQWAQEKVKWTSCNTSVRAQKLSTTARWTAVGKCMMQ